MTKTKEYHEAVEQMAQLLYSIASSEIDQFIDEYKVDVRKSRKWEDLPDTPSKDYWREQAKRFLIIC